MSSGGGAAGKRRWLAAVANHVCAQRPDLSDALLGAIGEQPAPGRDLLRGLTIGEIGVVYEALLATSSRTSRKEAGQFFTPDDAAQFMAAQSKGFPDGVWLDPCCGVGNLAWYLTAEQPDPAEFIKDNLVLIDRDDVARRTAVALIAAEYAGAGDIEAVDALWSKSKHRDFLARTRLPTFDYAIMNPPYARADFDARWQTASCQDFYAYFIERVAKTARGFIAVTPAAYLSGPKFRPIREVLESSTDGGDVIVFDNVPDTLFRGYKFGSLNTSKTNFVRAAITVCRPSSTEWRITPILRWRAVSRARMFEGCTSLLAPRRIGPDGEWAKLHSDLIGVWDTLRATPRTIADLTVSKRTRWKLTVPTTPRYYISASFSDLERGSKSELYFRTEHDRDHAALVLNSDIPLLWWRALDGGVTLPKRVLSSTPVPPPPENLAELVEELRASEGDNVVVKLNAGRENENIKHAESLVLKLDEALVPGLAEHAWLLRANDLFT